MLGARSSTNPSPPANANPNATNKGNSIEGRLAIAVECFRDAQYEKALSAYNSIIRHLLAYTPEELKVARRANGAPEVPIVGPLIHPKLASVLDQRAATYEKLGNLPKALKDGENLVKIEPIGCKGYLRLAKIQQLLGDETESYKTLQRGVYTITSAIKRYKIRVPTSLYEKLELRYRELNTKLKLQRENSKRVSFSDNGNKRLQQQSIDGVFKRQRSQEDDGFKVTDISRRSGRIKDPFQWLPLELIYLIYSNLPFSCVLTGHLVSSTWYNSLTSISTLYHSISFRNRIEKLEFLNGVKLLKRVYKNSSSRLVKKLKISKSLKDDHFLENLKYLAFHLNLKFETLEILNPNASIGEIILSFTKKHSTSTNVDFSGLESLESSLRGLKLGVSSEIRNIPYLLGILKNLRSLEIIQLSSKVNSVISLPEQIKLYLNENLSTNNLEVFTFIGSGSGESNGGDSSIPYLIRLLSSSLTCLTIVSQDLLHCNFRFENYPQLSEVYFENNSGYGLRNFILDITTPEGRKLTKLSFREKDDLNSEIFDGTTFRNLEFPRLSSLKLLDIYSSNLSRDGFYKLLEVCNKDQCNLSSLNIGNSRKLGFQIDTLQSRARNNNIPTSYISIKNILRRAPNLTHLYLNEVEFDNFSAKMFYKDLKDFDPTFEKVKLKFMDLSFARIDGTGLMDLFFVSIRQGVTFKLEELIINGVDVNLNTVQLLTSKGYVKKIQNDFRKTKWREFGKTSLIQ